MKESSFLSQGMVLLTLSVSLPWLRPPPCDSPSADGCSTRVNGLQVAVFFLALYVIAVGAGGTKPNITTFGAEQFDAHSPRERVQKLSFFNWWTFAVFYGNLFSSTVLVYIQDNVSFSVGYIIPTVGLAFSIAVFLLGTPFYRHKPRSSSPITGMARVLVAAVRKWNVALPPDPEELRKLEPEDSSEQGNRGVHRSSSFLRFLDKAAARTDSDSPWRPCSITQVEETKKIIKLLPVFVVTIVPSVMMAQVLTLFIKQGSTMDRSMGPHFQIPPASLSSFFTLGTLISVALYDRLVVPFLKRHTKNPRGITMLQRIGIGLTLHIFIMIIAAMVERRRLTAARSHGVVHETKTVPLRVFALLPQFALMGIAEMLVEVGKMEFFYDQAPEGMKSLGSSFFTTSIAAGDFASSFLLSTVAKATRKGGKGGWIQNDLNASHLDYYYGFLAALNAVNLVLFLVVCKFYVYNKEAVDAKDEVGKRELTVMSE